MNTRKRGRPVDKEARAFNVAIYRLLQGKLDAGGVAAQLAVLTGLSVDAIWHRSHDVQYRYPPEDEVSPGTGWTPSEVRHLQARYADSSDPAVKDFLFRVQGTRRHPDVADGRSRSRRRRPKLKDGVAQFSEN